MGAEQKLPDDLLKMATLRGKEYAWTPENVPHVIASSKELGLAVLGGQLQFRVPDGTCELYWIDFEADDKQGSESWAQFVQRAAQQCQQRFSDTIEKHDLLREGLESFRFLRKQLVNLVAEFAD